jgi:hypothetical protein
MARSGCIEPKPQLPHSLFPIGSDSEDTIFLLSETFPNWAEELGRRNPVTIEPPRMWREEKDSPLTEETKALNDALLSPFRDESNECLD